MSRTLSRTLFAGASALALLFATAAMAVGSGDSHNATSIANRASTATCAEAKHKLANAKRRLRNLKRDDASPQAIQRAKRRVSRARLAVQNECLNKVFEITSVSGKFDVTVTQSRGGGCTLTKDAHWTAALASGAPPARLEVYYRDGQGRIHYVLSTDGSGNIPLTLHGDGVATETCPNGTVSCDFEVVRYGEATVSSDPDLSRDPLTLNWYFGYNSFSYAAPANGGGCTYSGTSPPSMSPSEVSPGLFVSTLNDGSNFLEPLGRSTVPVSNFNGDTTLKFAGSGSASFVGSDASGSWQLSESLRRR